MSLQRAKLNRATMDEYNSCTRYGWLIDTMVCSKPIFVPNPTLATLYVVHAQIVDDAVGSV